VTRSHIQAYHRPEALSDAWEFVVDGNPEVRLLSGGADLTIHCPLEVTTLVDVSRVIGTDIVVGDDGAISFGGMATLSAVMEHETVAARNTGVIPEMMVHVGNPLLRNFSTIGGHLARGKLSDVVPVFLALDANVTLFNGETVTMSLDEYYTSSQHGRPHILTDVSLPPPPPRSAAAFLRFSRTAFDFPIINCCCRVDVEGDDIGSVGVVLGATPERGQWATNAAALVATEGLTDAAITAAAQLARDEIRTGSGWVASSEYRSHLVGVLVTRCLETVRDRLEATS
jgi:CO/xanthine dehydrogenase FAD-binding subunit